MKMLPYDVVSRVMSEASRLMVEHEDWTVQQCIDLAIGLEVALHGSPFEDTAAPLIGKSPLQNIREHL